MQLLFSGFTSFKFLPFFRSFLPTNPSLIFRVFQLGEVIKVEEEVEVARNPFHFLGQTRVRGEQTSPLKLPLEKEENPFHFLGHFNS
jgi:hypothetical protein